THFADFAAHVSTACTVQVSTGCDANALESQKLLDDYFGDRRNRKFPDLLVVYPSDSLRPPLAVLNYDDRQVRILPNEPNLWVFVFSTFAFDTASDDDKTSKHRVTLEGLKYDQSAGLSGGILSFFSGSPSGDLLKSRDSSSVGNDSL